MRKRDGRSLDHKALEDIRIQAVQRVEAGEAPSAVMRVMGFARTVIYDWLNKYRAGGIKREISYLTLYNRECEETRWSLA